MSNLFDSFKTYLSPELIGTVAQVLGENEHGVSKALGALAPAILGGLLEKSDNPAAMSAIFEAISRFDAHVLERLGELLNSGNLAHNDPKDAFGQLLGAVFGAKVPVMTNSIAAFSGLKPSSVSALLGLAGPMVMGILSRKIAADRLQVSDFAHWLAGNKAQIIQLAPAPLSASMGWIGRTAAAATPTATPAQGKNWLWPLLLLLSMGAAIAYCLKNCAL